MPIKVSKAKRLTTKAKRALRFLSIVSCQLLIVATLSGCTAFGRFKPAALQVTSTPQASIFLDGKHLGKTPFFSDQLKAGDYTLKISAGEANYTTRLNLYEGTLTVVNRELADNFLAQSGEILWLEKGQKGLFVASMPQNAELTIDGKFAGRTPYVSPNIDEGEHKLELSIDSFVNREFAIKTSPNFQLVVNATLASTLAKATNPLASPAPTQVFKKVEILNPPQGFLRVRSEPDLESSEIGRVKTGEQFEIIQETGDWLKIKFEGKLGWISTQYTKKLQ